MELVNSITATTQLATCENHLPLHIYRNLKFSFKKLKGPGRNVFGTFLSTYLQSIKIVKVTLDEGVIVIGIGSDSNQLLLMRTLHIRSI